MEPSYVSLWTFVDEATNSVLDILEKARSLIEVLKKANTVPRKRNRILIKIFNDLS